MARKSFPLSIAITRVALAPFSTGTEGASRIPAGPCVLAANHASFVDGVALVTAYAWSTFRPLHMISIQQPFRHPLWGWFLKSARCIPLRKASRSGSVETVRRALGYLRMGEAVGILPEAHVNPGLRLRRLRPGAAILALESGAPVLPAGILGSAEMLPPSRPYPQWGRRIRIRYGEPIAFARESEAYHAAPREERVRLVAAVLERLGRELARLCEKEPPRPPRRNRDANNG